MRSLPPAGLVPDDCVSFGPSDQCRRAAQLILDAGVPALEEHCDAPGMEDVERARLHVGAHQRSDDDRSFVRLDYERPCRRWDRVKSERHAYDQREQAPGAADELAEVVAGDVLDHLATGVRNGAVRKYQRHAEDEVARRPNRWRSGPERLLARHAPIVGSPGGSSDSRCP